MIKHLESSPGSKFQPNAAIGKVVFGWACDTGTAIFDTDLDELVRRLTECHNTILREREAQAALGAVKKCIASYPSWGDDDFGDHWRQMVELGISLKTRLGLPTSDADPDWKSDSMKERAAREKGK